jgi:hypothetical protein
MIIQKKAHLLDISFKFNEIKFLRSSHELRHKKTFKHIYNKIKSYKLLAIYKLYRIYFHYILLNAAADCWHLRP